MNTDMMIIELLERQTQERKSLAEIRIIRLREELELLGCIDMLESTPVVTVSNDLEVKLANKIDELNAIKSELKTARGQATKYKNKNEELKLEIKSLTKDKKDLKEELQSFRSNNVTLTNKNEIADLKKQVNQLDCALVNTKDELSDCYDAMAELKKQLEEANAKADTYKKSSETFQSKCSKLKIKLNNVEENDKPIENNKPVMTDEEILRQIEDERIAAELEASSLEEEQTKTVEPEAMKVNHVSEIVIVETKSDILQKVSSFKSRKNEECLYSTEKHFIMASPSCENITIIPKTFDTEITEADVALYKEELVKIGHPKNKVLVSPVTVDLKEGYRRGYFARVHAAEGVCKFNSNDLYSGYEIDKKRNQIMLWTWRPAVNDIPVVYHLSSLMKGQKGNAHSKVIEPIARFVSKMYEQYQKDVIAFQNVEEQEKVKNTQVHNESIEADRKEQEEFEAMVAAQKAKNNNDERVGDVDKEKPKAVMSSKSMRGARFTF